MNLFFKSVKKYYLLCYRSIRSPLGKTSSLSQDNGELHSSDSKSLSRIQSQIGTDKSKRTGIGQVRASESESSNEESDDETVTTGPSRSERLNELPPSVSTLLNRSAAARQESVEARNRSDSPRGKFIRSSTFDESRRSLDQPRMSSDTFRRDDEGTSSSSYQRRLIRTPTLEDEPRFD